MSYKRILYRLLFLGLTILIIPFLPIMIIFLGISSPEYVIYGTLNLNTVHSFSSWAVYYNFLMQILSFDFGLSTSSGQPVIVDVFSALLESIKPISFALLISLSLGTIIGIIISRYERIRTIWNRAESIFYIPIIVFSYLMLYFMDFLGIDFLSNIKYLVAGLILSIYPLYIVSKAISTTIKSVSNSDYFTFHKACGFSDKFIWIKFCKRFIIVDYLSFFENLLIFMFGFIFFVETPFGIYGVGHKFVLAIQRFDYPLIIGFCVFSIILFSFIGLISEAIKLLLDPREVNI